MTQDVQPLTWQKRTNLEEHQQFFSKINEIIDNLAPTVDEAEAAVAQATAAIASANDAIATANAASAAASAAATQAQTAASTVAGYDTRLTAAEGDIDALQAADQTIAGNVAALGTRMAAAESKNSQQDTAIAALQTADGQNVKISRINEYAIGLTGNQSSTGFKSGRFAIKEMSVSIPQPATHGKYRLMYTIKDIAANGVICGKFQDTSNAQTGYYGDFIGIILNSAVYGKISGITLGNYSSPELFFGYDGTDIDVWVKDTQYRPKQVRIDNISIYGQLQQPVIVADGSTTTDDYTTYKNYTVTGGITQ